MKCKVCGEDGWCDKSCRADEMMCPCGQQLDFFMIQGDAVWFCYDCDQEDED
jgi:hypothetical protein